MCVVVDKFKFSEFIASVVICDVSIANQANAILFCKKKTSVSNFLNWRWLVTDSIGKYHYLEILVCQYV